MTFKTKATGGELEGKTTDQIKLNSQEFGGKINGYPRNESLRR